MEDWLDVEMKRDGVQPDKIVFALLINSCAEAANVKRADYWFQKMKSESVSPDEVIYSGMVNACLSDGDVKRAESVLEEGLSLDGVRDELQRVCVADASVVV